MDNRDTFAHNARHDTIRLYSLEAQSNWMLYHLDVKSTFLRGQLHEEIHVNQLENFYVPGMED